MCAETLCDSGNDRVGRLAELRRRTGDVETRIAFCEFLGTFFVGSGLVILALPLLYANTVTELFTWIAGAAAPFNLAGFMYVAATNYQQQKQFHLLEKASLENEDVREHQRNLESELIREKQCERLLDAYLRLHDSVDLLRPGFEVDSAAVTRGAAGFALLKATMIQSPPLNGADGRALAERCNSPIVRERLAPFLVAIKGIMDAVEGLAEERRLSFRTQLAALLTKDERDVISMFQQHCGPDVGASRQTLNQWLEVMENA